MGMSTVQLVRPRRFGDARGWFSETFSKRLSEELGIASEFVQDNHSMSAAVGTLRGLHFQVPPRAQGKLVRCTSGAILDYALDVRRGSPTYGRWVSAELTAENGHQLWVAVGFAHAFITLRPNTEVIYKVTNYYAPECDGGIRWDSVGIDWPLPPGGPILSEKDRILPSLAEFESPFSYDGEPLPERLS